MPDINIPKDALSVKNMRYIQSLTWKERIDLMGGFITVYIVPLALLGILLLGAEKLFERIIL